MARRTGVRIHRAQHGYIDLSEERERKPPTFKCDKCLQVRIGKPAGGVPRKEHKKGRGKKGQGMMLVCADCVPRARKRSS